MTSSKSTAAPDRRDVIAAIDVLTTSFRYDPKDRWVEAYALLARLRAELRRAWRPYGLARLIAYIGALFTYGAAYLWLIDNQGFSIWWFWALLALASLVNAIVGAVTTALATRRHPLLKLRREIEEACKYFDEVAQVVAPEAVAT